MCGARRGGSGALQFRLVGELLGLQAVVPGQRRRKSFTICQMDYRNYGRLDCADGAP